MFSHRKYIEFLKSLPVKHSMCPTFLELSNYFKRSAKVFKGMLLQPTKYFNGCLQVSQIS